jgi:urease accessory protein UreF
VRIDSIKITFNNGFEKIVERDTVKNFNSLIEWLEMFNNGEFVNLLTMSGKELGSSFSIDKNNIKSIEIL